MPALTADSSAPPAAHPPASTFQALDEDIVSSRLAVIIGWLGAKDRTLQKYADWYRQSGWTPLVFTFPASSCLTLARATARRQACLKTILDAFDAAEQRATGAGTAAAAPPRPPTILMHSFSNTGWLVYCALLGDLAAARPAALAAIQGAVIDSAPFPGMSPEVWAAGFLTAAAGSPRKRADKDKAAQEEQDRVVGGKAGAAAGAAAASCSTTPIALTSNAPDRSSLAFRATATFFRVWMQGARKRALKAVIADEARLAAWPALYIFCEDDHVIPATSVRAAAAEHARRGGGAWAARTLCFQSSEHVAHLRHHRAAYTAALASFVGGDVLKTRGEVVASAPAVIAPLPPLAVRVAAAPPTTALGQSLSRTLSFKVDPSALALARTASIKAGPASGGGLSGLAPIMGRSLTRAGSIRAAAGGEVGSPTAAMAALLSARPQLM